MVHWSIDGLRLDSSQFNLGFDTTRLIWVEMDKLLQILHEHTNLEPKSSKSFPSDVNLLEN